MYVPAELPGGFARTQLEQIDIARRMIARYPDRLAFATTADEVGRAMRAGKVASLPGIEGGHAIEGSLGALRAYFDLGVRYMTLTHNATLDWADAAGDAHRHGGLTRFGQEVVREMNRLGMLVDLSHASDETMEDALRVSEAPVIFSHSSARALCDVPRNVPDVVLATMKANGGVCDGHLRERVRLAGVGEGERAALFMGVNLAVMRQFFFRPPAGHARNRLTDLVVPSVAFLFCLWIWLSLPTPAKMIGGAWCVLGLIYTAIKTRGFRTPPVMMDLSGA